MVHKRKLLIVQAAALGWNFAKQHLAPDWQGPAFRETQSVFPALTCPVQASFRTAAPPARHGMIANGLYHRALSRPLFWEQSTRQVEGPRLWDSFRLAGRHIALLFWQQSLGESADLLLSPAPIHKHHGGMIMDCYSRPASLYDDVRAQLGRPFRLARYWGPLASHHSSDWIAEATGAVLSAPKNAPDLCLTYLPVLDYDLQRFGPDHRRAARAARRLHGELRALIRAAEARDYHWLIYGDYAMAPVTRPPLFPNRLLADMGLMSVRDVRGRSYPDLYASRAFAVADHEIAHVYIPQAADIPAVRNVLEHQEGIECVMTREEYRSLRMDHPNAGELLLIAGDGTWFAYPWWHENERPPEFAGHVDIHNKPGYDPCELFFGCRPGRISRHTARVRGTHGKTGPDRTVAWSSSFIQEEPEHVIALAEMVKQWLNHG